MKTTHQGKLCAGLQVLGWQPDPADRSRYKAFRHHEHTGKAFVGVNGALRLGRNASESHSIGDPRNQTSFYQEGLAACEQGVWA